MLVLNGTDEDFNALLNDVETVYMATNPMSQRMTVNNPKTLTGFHFDGIGGAICDELTPGIVFCQYLVIDKTERRKGHALKIIEQLDEFYSEAGKELAGAFVESSAGIDLWEKAGFKVQGTVNLCPVKTKRPVKEIFKDFDNGQEGVSIEQLYDLMYKNFSR